MSWVEPVSALIRRLRPDARTRRLHRYYIFELLAQNLSCADEGEQTEVTQEEEK
jgi:hypothetical protein